MTSHKIVDECNIQSIDFFEGAEKRLSITSDSNFRSIDKTIWVEILKKTGCTVIDIIENDHFQFYLLSESSFIIGSNFMMIKTCGSTRPLTILDNMSDVSLKSMLYSHYDFMKPELQPEPYQSIQNEEQFLKTILDKNCEFNKLNKWFYFKAGSFDATHNMYELVCKNFVWISHKPIIEIINHFFHNYQLSEKCFEPCGYSLNLLCDRIYITIHVTPQESCSYLSVETNFEDSLNLFKKMIDHLNTTDFEIHSSKQNDIHCISSIS